MSIDGLIKDTMGYYMVSKDNWSEAAGLVNTDGEWWRVGVKLGEPGMFEEEEGAENRDCMVLPMEYLT